MNIIYIHHYSGSFKEPREWRPYYLSKGLVARGACCSVICASYHHLQKQPYEQVKNINQKNVDGILFNWLKTPSYTGNGFGRIKNMLYFGWQVFKVDPVKDLGLDKPDLIIISSAHPFHLLGAIKWSKKYKAKIFFEVRDIWPLSLNLMLNLSKYHPFSILLSVFQYIGLKYTDKTIGLGKNMDAYFFKHGLENDKFLYVCNGIDEEQPISTKSDYDLQLNLIRKKYSRIVMYTGSHGIPNALFTLIDAMNIIDDNKIALLLIGDGILKNELQNRAKNKNIFFFNAVPKNQIQHILSFSDICIISWQKLELYKFGVSPNKIFDYMFAKKPIIQALECTGNHVDESNCGINIEPENIQVMKETIQKFCSLEDNKLENLGKQGYNYVIENFEYKQLADKILNLID